VKRAAVLLIGTVWLSAGGCSSRQSQTPADSTRDVLFSGTLQELVPYNDGDELVFLLLGAGSLDGVYVQRVAVPHPGEITVTLTRENLAIGQISLHSDGTTLFVTREETAGNGVALQYDDPLPYISVPLRTGITEASSAVALRRLTTGETLARGHIEQRLNVLSAPATPPRILFEVRNERHLTLGDRSTIGRTTSWLQPGLGTVLSETLSETGTVTRQQLLCAIIAGQQIGDCDAAKQTRPRADE
jgi:hypothetical protein